jgi:hypothetical protein
VIIAASGTDYPLLNAFLTILYLFLWILWIFILVRILLDIFRSADLSGWGKAGWTILIIILPFLGAFIYLIARGGEMHTREVRDAQQSQDEFRQYVQQTAAEGTGTADELAKLAQLRDQGVLTEAEFNAQKAKLLV